MNANRERPVRGSAWSVVGPMGLVFALGLLGIAWGLVLLSWLPIPILLRPVITLVIVLLLLAGGAAGRRAAGGFLLGAGGTVLPVLLVTAELNYPVPWYAFAVVMIVAGAALLVAADRGVGSAGG